MVIPVNPDKPIASTPDKPAQSHRASSPEQEAGQPRSTEAGDAKKAEAPVEIDSARQLYQLESKRTATAGPNIQTPEQAERLLGQVLQQLAAEPETAARIQTHGAKDLLGSLLAAAPA